MGWSYDALIAELTGKLNLAETETYWGRKESTYARNHWLAAQDHLAIDDLIDAVNRNNQAIEYVMCQGFYQWNGSSHALTDALDRDKACPFITECPPVDVTMDAILSAMITANFDDFQMFVGIVDGYRTALWNEPFNVDMYAALARGFMR